MQGFAGKVAVVTGAGSGIGQWSFLAFEIITGQTSSSQSVMT